MGDMNPAVADDRAAAAVEVDTDADSSGTGNAHIGNRCDEVRVFTASSVSTRPVDGSAI